MGRYSGAYKAEETQEAGTVSGGVIHLLIKKFLREQM